MKFSSLYYHNLTSYKRRGISPHFLDWENQPRIFKRYDGVDTIDLPRKVAVGDLTLFQILKERPGDLSNTQQTLDILSSILLLTCTITAQAMHSGTPFYFRNVASAGALYPFELYLLAEGVHGLASGLYHYAIDGPALHPLRQGISVSQTHSLNFFLSTIFFRSSWKYRDRAYRYCLLDTGHLLENLVLSLRGHGFSPQVTYDFDDSLINSFLGFDPDREVCLSVCCTDNKPDLCPALPSQEKWGTLPQRAMEASVVSVREVKYDAIATMHEASSVLKPGPYQGIKMDELLGVSEESLVEIPQVPAWPDELPYPQVVFSRRSRRNFVPRTMSQHHFESILDGLCSDSLLTGYPWLTSIGLLVTNTEGYGSGFYLLDRRSRKLALVKEGNFQGEMARICLDQAWLANAALHVLFISNLKVLDEVMGPRGYRHTMLEAGRAGQLLYLTATSLGLGCCGIGAFYDQEAAHLLGLNDNSKLLYLVALGPVKSVKGH